MQEQYDQRLLDLYDRFAHGLISRRQFIDRASKITAGGLSAAAILNALSPDYSRANQGSPDDPEIAVHYQEYDSPQGAGTMRAYMAVPADAPGKLPGVIVIHENRGLNPYIEDVARRVAKA